MNVEEEWAGRLPHPCGACASELSERRRSAGPEPGRRRSRPKSGGEMVVDSGRFLRDGQPIRSRGREARAQGMDRLIPDGPARGDPGRIRKARQDRSLPQPVPFPGGGPAGGTGDLASGGPISATPGRASEGLKPCYNEDTGECDFEADWLPAADRSGMGIRLPGRDRFRLLIRQRSRGSSATSPGSPTTPPRRLIPSARRSPIRGASSTCTATWPSGARMSTTRAITRPAPRRTRADPTSGNEYVLRGGSWKSPADAVRSAYRIGENPGFSDACLARDAIGFRCVRKAPPSKDAG